MSVPATDAEPNERLPDDRAARSQFGGFLLAMAAIIVLALGFRIYLDKSSEYLTEIYLDRTYTGVMSRLLLHKPFWYFFLPIPEFKGVWATTGFIPIYFLEKAIGPYSTYLLLTTCAIGAYGVGCWMIFRRALPSAMATSALAISPFNYHIYIWNGSNNAYLTIAFLSLSMGFYFSYVLHEGRKVQLAMGTVLLVFAALSYEIWLNLVVIFIVLTPPIVLFLRRHVGARIVRRYLLVFSIMLVVAVAYTVIRALTLYKTAIGGSEFQFVWDHRTVGAMVDDLIFSTVFFFYMSISQLLPGFAGTSLAIYEAGKLNVEVLQQGYQPELYPVVAAHYLNLWMMYAGGSFVAAGAFGVFALRKGIRTGASSCFVAGLVCTALLVGSATYVILKFVPFNIAPIYAYKVSVALIVLFLAFGYFVDQLTLKLQKHWYRVGIASMAAMYLFLVAFTRPIAVNENIREIWGQSGLFGFGFVPDPWRNLKTIRKGLFELRQ